MTKLFAIVLILAFTSCAEKKWTKSDVVNTCLKEFNKKNDERKIFNGMEIPLVCDCMADKMIEKYDTERKANKDKEGMQTITTDCVVEVMGKRPRF